MVTKRGLPVQEKGISEALAITRKMQQDWLEHGLDFVDLYVEDWAGDWLEKWGEDDTEKLRESLIESVSDFLEGDNLIAEKLRNSIQASETCPQPKLDIIATELVNCLYLPKENEQRLFAVKTVLADNIKPTSEFQEISLLDLAGELLATLEAIQSDNQE